MGLFDYFRKSVPVPNLNERLTHLSKSLRDEHLDRWADQLDEVMLAAATGLELHMSVRHMIKQILASGIGSPQLRERAASLVKDLNRAIR
jgi:hypothetical protein